MQKFKVSELIPHSQNEFFFDDMEGQKWKEFLESVRTSGVIEPPVVTSEMVIVSGHQRVRACKELGIEEVYCEIRKYDDPDRIVKDLIETNIRQRGTIAGSELKMGRIIKELERIYGIKNGVRNDRKLPHSAEGKSQADIAKELGMSVDVMNRLKKLSDLPVEFQEMLESGTINAKTGYTLIAKLSEDEQIALLEKLPSAQKFTQAQIQEYIDKIKGLEQKNADLEKEKDELQEEAVEAVKVAKGASKASKDSAEYLRMKSEMDRAYEERRKFFEEVDQLKKKLAETNSKHETEVKRVKEDYRKLVAAKEEKIEELESAGPEIIEIEVEKIPDDYEELKAEVEQLRKVASRKVSKEPQIRVVDPDRTKEELAQVYFTDAQNSSGPFLAEMEGLVLSKDLCDYLPDRERIALAENFRLIISRAEEILGHLWKTNRKEIA